MSLPKLKQIVSAGLQLIGLAALVLLTSGLLPRRAKAMNEPVSALPATPMEPKMTLSSKLSQGSNQGSGMISVGRKETGESGCFSQESIAEVQSSDLPKAISVKSRQLSIPEESFTALTLEERPEVSVERKGKEKLIDPNFPQAKDGVPIEEYGKETILTSRRQALRRERFGEASPKSAKPTVKRTTSARMGDTSPTCGGIGGRPPIQFVGISRSSSDNIQAQKRLCPPPPDLFCSPCSTCCDDSPSASETAALVQDTPLTAPMQEIGMVEHPSRLSDVRRDVRAQASGTEREPSRNEQVILDISDEASWEKGYVQTWPSDKPSQKSILAGYKGKPMETWPRFGISVKKEVMALAKEVGVNLDNDAFRSKTSLTSKTYAPIRNAAKSALQPSRRKDNRKNPVKILHRKDEIRVKVDVFGRYATDHGGEIDIYAGKSKQVPCLGVADPDTGLIYPFSKCKTDRFLP